jgi:hypothetical protein
MPGAAIAAVATRLESAQSVSAVHIAVALASSTPSLQTGPVLCKRGFDKRLPKIKSPEYRDRHSDGSRAGKHGLLAAARPRVRQDLLRTCSAPASRFDCSNMLAMDAARETRSRLAHPYCHSQVFNSSTSAAMTDGIEEAIRKRFRSSAPPVAFAE